MRPSRSRSHRRSRTRPPGTSAAGGSCSSTRRAASRPSSSTARPPPRPSRETRSSRRRTGTTTRRSACRARVRGLELAHKKFGKLPWKDLVLPGGPAGGGGFRSRRADGQVAERRARSRASNDEFRRLFGKDGGKPPWQVGDRLVQKDLAKTLRRIAERRRGRVLHGELADLLVAEMKAGGGFITKDDLAAYQAKERKPVHGTYRGYDVYGPPPPSSGGIVAGRDAQHPGDVRPAQDAGRVPRRPGT